ncbi:MAG: hypothetical protein ACREIA_23225, partial [Opitutaceae bacterium]
GWLATVGDGSTGALDTGGASHTDTQLLSILYDPVTSVAMAIDDGVPPSPTSLAGLASLTSAIDLGIGGLTTPGASLEGELSSACVAHRALSAAARKRLKWELQTYRNDLRNN